MFSNISFRLQIWNMRWNMETRVDLLIADRWKKLVTDVFASSRYFYGSPVRGIDSARGVCDFYFAHGNDYIHTHSIWE